MRWNLRPINSCHPECSLTVTTKPPRGDCECKQLLKSHIWDCVAVRRSGLHTVNTSPFWTHKRCSFVGLANAPPLSPSSRAQYVGECGRQMQSCFAPCSPPYTDPVFPSTAESAGGKTGGCLLWGVMLPHRPHQAQMSASHTGSALLLLWQECDLCFSGSSICFIQGNQSKCLVPSPDPSEVSDAGPVHLSGTRI